MSLSQQARALAVHTADTTKYAVRSKAYFYPPLGVIYFLNHPSLWSPLLSRMLPCIALSVGVVLPMFLFTYVPQAAVLTVLNGPLGPVNAVALVLSESSVIITTIARSFLLQQALTDVFDATLLSEGKESLVARGRELHPGSGKEGVKKLGKALMQPLHKFSPQYLIQYLITMPLNLIPIVGTALFLITQGRKSGPSYHSRYFQLKKFDGERRDRFIAERKGAYIAFGTATMVINLIPFTSILFMFTSTIGAALWAAEIEKGTPSPGEGVDLSGQEYPNDTEGKKDL